VHHVHDYHACDHDHDYGRDHGAHELFLIQWLLDVCDLHYDHDCDYVYVLLRVKIDHLTLLGKV
jgi:hypothetical protein